MAESKVQFTTTAEVAGLKAWIATVKEGARALDEMTAAQRRNDAAGGGGGGGAAPAVVPGMPPPPSPVTPEIPGGAPSYPTPSTWFTPPSTHGPPAPSPVAPSGPAPNYPTPSPWFTPPPVYAPPTGDGGAPVDWFAPVSVPPGAAPPAPTPGTPPPPSPPSPSPSPSGRGGNGGPPADPNRFMARVARGASTGLGVGVGMALGGSALGFLFSAGEQFMEVDRILGQLDQRFGNAQGVREFGSRLGYTVEQAASLATILGSVENRFSARTASRYTGFARVAGLDPEQTVGQLALIGRMGGATLSNAGLAGISAGAARVGMGQGRMPEYLEVLGAMMAQQQQVMGLADVGTQQRTLEMISRAFGGRDIGTGHNALDIAGRLQGVMTGGALTPFLMRAMGFGRDPNLGYVEMRKRMEAGINDPRNLVSLFETFSQRGYSSDQMFRALESVSGGSLRAVEIEALVSQLGTEKGRADYLAAPPTAAARDYAAAGAGTVTRGEARAVQLEGMKLEVGNTVSQMMGDLTAAAQNLMRASENLFGGGIGDAATGLTGILERLTAGVEKGTQLVDDIWRWWNGGSSTRPLTPEQVQRDRANESPPGQRQPSGVRER